MRILIFIFEFIFFCAIIRPSLAMPANISSILRATVVDSAKKATNAKTILFLGNSLSAGYGLDPELAFPARIQQNIDSLNWNFQVVNAGLSGETSSGGLRRVDWLLQRRVDILVLELGGNDGLRGITLDLTKQNLQAILDRVKARYPAVKIVIAGMQVPPNLGQEYTTQFRALYAELAKKNRALFIPFLLEGVGGVPHLNLPDGIHPTAEGHRLVAENVWKILLPLLKSMRE
jgi:acyl-CoA thioesterase-1